MDAEFDTVAAWTAEVAVDLGRDSYLPAGCRGSGSPAALDWLLGRLRVEAGDRMLDCGAGVGGPAGYAADRTGVRPVVTDPEPGACRAARRLFGLPAAQAGAMLPFRGGAFDVVWSLGVLCTVDEQDVLLAELRRVLRPAGRLGLLVFVAERSPVPDPPEGNDFPTMAALEALVIAADLRIEEVGAMPDTPPSGEWRSRTDAVEAELKRRHGSDPAWRTAEEQSARIGELLEDGALSGRLLVARPAGAGPDR